MKKIEVRLCSNDVVFDYYELYNVLDRKLGFLIDENNICFVYRGDVFWKIDLFLFRYI